MLCGVEAFLSEESVKEHKEYLKHIKLKYSVIEKSVPQIIDVSAFAIRRMRRLNDKGEILELKCNIDCHELFFKSFGNKYQSSNLVRKKYRSEASFLYEIYRTALDDNALFVIISCDRGDVQINKIKKFNEFADIRGAVLSVDLCEHSYFQDYRFDKESYLKSALSYLNLSALDDFS